MSEKTKTNVFHALHVRGRPIVLCNIWDVGSAKAVEAAGATAIATGSWSVAASQGFADGEKAPIALVLDNARRIAAATALPVSVDIESGYGFAADDVARTVTNVAATGVVGCNLEDSFPENGTMRTIAMQVERLTAARRSADDACPGFFINARTDIFFQTSAQPDHHALVAEAIERALAYAAAGADGIFVPGLTDETLIARLCEASPLPVNVMVGQASPTHGQLAAAGVARISHGPGPYLATMQALRDAAALVLGASG